MNADDEIDFRGEPRRELFADERPAPAPHRAGLRIRMWPGEPFVEAVNAREVQDGLRYGAEAVRFSVTSPHRILLHRHGRVPLQCDEGDVRQDWGTVQHKHRGRGVGQRARDKFSREVKAMVAENPVRLRAMNPSAPTVEAVRNLRVIINPSALESLMMLPPLDDDPLDHVCLLKGYARPNVHDLPLGQPTAD